MKSWEVKKIGDVCTLKSGTTVNKSLEKTSGDVPYLKVADMSLPENDLVITTSSRFLNEDALKKNSLFPIGTTIFPKRGGAILTNKKRLTAIPVCADLNIMGVIPSKALLPKFLYFYFLNIDMRELGSGSSIPQINNYDIAPLTIAFPTCAEQKRIVAILDEAFERIDGAIANTEKNLANARELFESYLNSIFTRKGDNWVDVRLGEIATFRNGLNFTKNSKGESIKIVGVKDFQNNFWIDEEQLETVTIDEDLKEIDILREGDILTVRSNGNKELIGRCILAGELSEKTSHSGFTIRIRIERPDVYLPFAVHYLKSRTLRRRLIESGDGISISSLNQQKLSLIELSFPPLEKQQSLVTAIDELSGASQRLEAIYQQKLAALNELKQSILQKAFSGELTTDTAAQAANAAQEVTAA
ncbi:restriction endonuclease subunit S [Nodosilinea sp. P-1105]|uniref:restriction endonuclease subunit S n=1 Tax=Nodosilinea sp. P-1105 TaxID=2546229 RepID=UPI00146C483A|nr:restriction endonuclease subunit S [Nodosilinea sp. P-1105]NMF83232.1 hypothetical protein [Nodosilinea sp. P-1105]